MRIDAPEITGSLIVSGSISISGSLNINGSNISSGNGGTVSPGTISGSTQISALGFVSASVTGSSLISASIASNTITLNKGNGTTLAIVLPEGSVPTDITALNVFSASMNTFTASASSSIAALNSWTGSTFTTYTASVSTSVGVLQGYTASVSTSVGLLQGTASYLNTTFSTSVNSRLNNVAGGGSTDITALNVFSASMYSFTASMNTFTASASSSIAALNSWTGSTFTTYTASVSSSIAALNSWTGSTFTTFSASVSTSVGLLQGTASYLNTTFSQSVNSRLNNAGGSTDITALNLFSASINTFTASAATTGSNRFTGNQTITGSLSISGSLRGNVLTPVWQPVVPNVSSTWSMDFSKSNFFQLWAVQGNNHISASNWQPGQTVSLKILRTETNMTASFAPAFKFPSGSAYTASVYSSEPAGVEDIITFITYDADKIYASSVKNMV